MLQQKFELILAENQKLVCQVEGFRRAKSNSVSSAKNQDPDETNQLRSHNQLLKREMQ